MRLNRSAGARGTRAQASDTTALTGFREAQQHVLDRYGVDAESRLVTTMLGGRAHVLVAGGGPPLAMVTGGLIPAAFWAPLMARLPGHTLYAIELPGFGLTEPVRYHHTTLRPTAVAFLSSVLDSLGLDGCRFVTQSMGSQWTAWLAGAQPGRVRSQVMLGCPAFFLDTSAPLPMRLLSVPGLGRAVTSLEKPSAKGAERVIRMVGEDPSDLPEIQGLLLATQQLPSYRGSMLALLRAAMRWTRPRAVSLVTAADLRRVGHPVRLIWGEQDPFGRLDSGRRVAELIPEADFRSVPGGHAPWLNHSELVADLTRPLVDEHS
jgi:pimeloyl-ACP methyl ester carboxylesterase